MADVFNANGLIFSKQEDDGTLLLRFTGAAGTLDLRLPEALAADAVMPILTAIEKRLNPEGVTNLAKLPEVLQTGILNKTGQIVMRLTKSEPYWALDVGLAEALVASLQKEIAKAKPLSSSQKN